MNYQTIVAAFDTPANGQAAVEPLKAGGFHAEDISSFDKSRRVGLRQPGLWDRMFGGGLAQHQADVYNQSLKGDTRPGSNHVGGERLWRASSVASNNTLEGRFRNRRIEYRVVKPV